MSVGTLNLIWFGEVYNALLHGVGVSLAARRLTDDPRLIVMASTLGLLFTGSVGPFVNYLSDRIWTPFGRRRPFLVLAYSMSAIGLCVIPYMDSITTLLLAVAAHAFVHSFASPAEPLYMELVPQAQQGRAQAIRHGAIQASVLFFFQVSLVQFEHRFALPLGALAPAGGTTGVHLSFWLGGAILFLMAVYLAVCVRESPPVSSPTEVPVKISLRGMLRSFPREVFADWRWWPAYGLYVAPAIVTAVWGNLQPLMVTDQFGFSLNDMARIGLPVSLTGMVLVAPLLGHVADRSRRIQPRPLLLAALTLLGAAYWAYQALPENPRELPALLASLSFCVPLGLGMICLLLLAVAMLEISRVKWDLRVSFIILAMFGQATLAVIAWLWTKALPGSRPVMPMAVWLAYLTAAQVLSLAITVCLVPLLFSRIPSSKFGTVSSGFGIFNAMTTYTIGNLGGLWVHAWTGWQGAPNAQYTSLWLLQFGFCLFALAVVLRCLRTKFMAGAQTEDKSSPTLSAG